MRRVHQVVVVMGVCGSCAGVRHNERERIYRPDKLCDRIKDLRVHRGHAGRHIVSVQHQEDGLCVP